MKIIFDSEEEKEALLYGLINGFCPSDLYLNDDYTCSKLGCHVDCEICWENCGIEVEVKSND